MMLAGQGSTNSLREGNGSSTQPPFFWPFVCVCVCVCVVCGCLYVCLCLLASFGLCVLVCVSMCKKDLLTKSQRGGEKHDGEKEGGRGINEILKRVIEMHRQRECMTERTTKRRGRERQGEGERERQRERGGRFLQMSVVLCRAQAV